MAGERVLTHVLAFAFIFLAGISSGFCADSTQSPAAPDGQVWVTAHFSGGVQCMYSTRHPSLAETEKFLKDNSVMVHERKEENGAVCAACGCPEYSYTQFFLVNTGDEKKAKDLITEQKNKYVTSPEGVGGFEASVSTK